MLYALCFTVNSEANTKRIAFVEQCFGSSGQVCINRFYSFVDLLFS